MFLFFFVSLKIHLKKKLNFIKANEQFEKTNNLTTSINPNKFNQTINRDL